MILEWFKALMKKELLFKTKIKLNKFRVKCLKKLEELKVSRKKKLFTVKNSGCCVNAGLAKKYQVSGPF